MRLRALLLAVTVSLLKLAVCYKLEVSNSSGLLAALNDEQADIISLENSIKVVNTTASPWTTVFLRRNLLISGNDSSILDWNLIPELIVIEPGYDLQFRYLFIRGALRTASYNSSLIGQYSKFKSIFSIAWPSVVFLPGANVTYNKTTSLGLVGQTAIMQAQNFINQGLGDYIDAPDAFTLSIRGYHARNVSIIDVTANQTVGSGYINLENVIALFPPDAGSPAPSQAPSLGYALTGPPIQPGGCSGLNWWEGLLIGAAGAFVVLTLIYGVILYLYKKKVGRQFRRLSDNPLNKIEE